MIQAINVKKSFGENACIVVKQGDRQIARYKRAYMSASSMEKFSLPLALFESLDPNDGAVTVCATEQEA